MRRKAGYFKGWFILGLPCAAVNYLVINLCLARLSPALLNNSPEFCHARLTRINLFNLFVNPK